MTANVEGKINALRGVAGDTTACATATSALLACPMDTSCKGCMEDVIGPLANIPARGETPDCATFFSSDGLFCTGGQACFAGACQGMVETCDTELQEFVDTCSPTNCEPCMPQEKMDETPMSNSTSPTMPSMHAQIA